MNELNKSIGENIYVKEDYVIIGSITLTIEEFKEIFSYLLNIDNFESKYNDPKLKNAQLCIYMDIISNINNKTISSKRISKILILIKKTRGCVQSLVFLYSFGKLFASSFFLCKVL